jgi:hypothetical protein
VMATFDMMGDLGRSTHTHYSKDAT